MTARVRLWGATLARVLMLISLVGIGMWRVLAVRADISVAELARDLKAGPAVTVEWPVFGTVLGGVARLRESVGQVVSTARPVTGAHRRLATRLDDFLLGWLERFQGFR